MTHIRRFRFSVITVIVLSIILSVFCALTVGADNDGEHSGTVIDNACYPSKWSAVGVSVAKALYTDENRYLAAGEDDSGYIVCRKDAVAVGDVITVTSTFTTSVSFYKYTDVSLWLSLDYALTDTFFSVTVTLYSDSHEYSHTEELPAGQWQQISIPVGDWTDRDNFTSVSVSVSPLSNADPTDTTAPLICRIDNLTASGTADTAYADRFMTESFTVSGGSYSVGKDNSVRIHHSVRTTVTFTPLYENVRDVSHHNKLYAVIASDTPTDIKLLVTYADGNGYIGDSVTVSGETPTAYLFNCPAAANIESITFSASSDASGSLYIYNIDTFYISNKADSITDAEKIGSLDICSLAADGSINLRGTVDSDTVVSHLNGKISVYAIPIYADAEEYLTASSPIATVDMTTKFNITVDASDLPEGASTMLYTVMIEDGDVRRTVASPRLPAVNGIGVTIPYRSHSLKGLAHSDITARDAVAVTELTIDLSHLLGDLSSGRIYSAFGNLYYFNTEYLRSIDAAVRSLSLSGTDVYVRLVESYKDGDAVLYRGISANDKDSFETLHAVVDFLTQRYRSSDYGYICGIIAGNSEADTVSAVDPQAAALTKARTAAVIYGAGAANIDAFRVLLPFGDSYIIGQDGNAPNELILKYLSHYADEFYLNSYGIIWQTDSLTSDSVFTLGVDAASVLKHRLSSQKGIAPSVYFIEYASDVIPETASALTRAYTEAYYSACRVSSTNGFIFKPVDGISNTVWDDFIKYYNLLDTDKYAEVEAYIEADEGVTVTLSADAEKQRAHPYTYTESDPIRYMPSDIIGSYELFSYSDAYDTGGWFAIDADGECVTVKTESGRSMRSYGGIMYSSAADPLNLSASPVIAIDASTPSEASYDLYIYSKSGILKAPVLLNGDTTVYIDISEFAGLNSVYSMMLVPNSSSRELYISAISVCSRELNGSELETLYHSASKSDDVAASEENIVQIVAVIFLLLTVSAAVWRLLRRRVK